MTVLEKIKRCVSLVWDFQEIYGEEDIEDFCRNELRTYPQHDEIMEYFKHIEELEKENAELKEELTKKADINHSLVEQMADLESENAELKSKNKWCSEQVCYKECAEVWGNLTKAIDLLKKMYYLYFEPCVTHKDLKNRDKLFEEVKQFLKE